MGENFTSAKASLMLNQEPLQLCLNVNPVCRNRADGITTATIVYLLPKYCSSFLLY